MEQLGFFERIGNLFKIIFMSPSFLLLLVLFILTIVLLVINLKVKKKFIKVLCGLFYLALAAFIVVFYGKDIFLVSDKIVDKIFTVLYFPNYISYLCMMVISVILLLMTWMNKKLSNFAKIGNTGSFMTLFFLFLLTLDIVTKNEIDITSKVDIYQNDALIVLVQSSMGIFAIWIGVLVVDYIVRIIVKNLNGAVVEVATKINNPKLVTDDNLADLNVSVLTEAGFEKGFKRYQSKMRYQEYIDMVTDYNN